MAMFQAGKGKGNSQVKKRPSGSLTEALALWVKSPNKCRKGPKTPSPNKKVVKGPKLASPCKKLAEGPQSPPKVLKVCKLPFPGIPKKPVEPLELNHWRVYTDIARSCWRCKRIGVRTDTAASWKVDPVAAWQKVCRTVSTE
jgi:hypothetical protein